MIDRLKDFITKSNLIHDNFYDYSIVVYKNNRIPVEIICPVHGSFYQKPIIHNVQKCGCMRK